jgi:hypothetical protein
MEDEKKGQAKNETTQTYTLSKHLPSIQLLGNQEIFKFLRGRINSFAI